MSAIHSAATAAAAADSENINQQQQHDDDMDELSAVSESEIAAAVHDMIFGVESTAIAAVKQLQQFADVNSNSSISSMSLTSVAELLHRWIESA